MLVSRRHSINCFAGSALIVVLVALAPTGRAVAAGDSQPKAVSAAPVTPSVAHQVKPVPAWAMELARGDMWEYQGKFGLAYDPFPKTIAPNVSGIDYWQANHFIVYRKETKDYLYCGYSPTQVHYVKGTLPAFEAVADRYTRGLTSDREKAVALLQKAMPENFLHPALPPLSPRCAQDRGLADEELLKTGKGWCNEQSRVFVRLCQVSGIPARMIYLFYTETNEAKARSGHVVAEFYADGHWSLADNTWLCIFPAADGHLMSAAECHERANRGIVGQVYYARNQALLRLPDEEIAGKRYADVKDPAERRRKIAEAVADQKKELGPLQPDYLGGHLDEFGVLNYPLPPLEQGAN